MREPPKLATALVKMFGAEAALVGDLAERYESGRSCWWYWRQVIAAIGHNTVRDIRLHPLLAVRAVLVGWVFLWIGTRVVFTMVELPEWLFATGIAPTVFRHGTTFPSWMRGFPATAVWKALVFAGSGWIIARTHSRNTSIVVSYAAFIGCANAVAFVFYVLDPHRYYSIWQLSADLLFLYPIAAFGGGLCGVVGFQRQRLNV